MIRGQTWYDALAAALHGRGVGSLEVREIVADTRADAEVVGREPAEVFGPAGSYAVEIAQALRTQPQASHPRSVGPVVLRLQGVGKRYRGHRVVSEVNLTVRAGEVDAIVGPNGSGKSTVLHMVAGLTAPSEGRIERCAHVGLMPQDGGTSDWLTVAEHFELFGAARAIPAGRARATGERLAAGLGWRPRAGQVAAHLSGGTRQKLNLILGQLSRPDLLLLLLDEPYQGLDQSSYNDFWDDVRSWRDTGTAIVLVTHLLHERDTVDHVLELSATQDRR